MGVGDSATGRGPVALLLADDVQAFAVALAIYLRGVYAGQVVPGVEISEPMFGEVTRRMAWQRSIRCAA
jgi:hypothetical protein